MMKDSRIVVSAAFVALVQALQHARALYRLEARLAVELGAPEPGYFLSRCEALFVHTYAPMRAALGIPADHRICTALLGIELTSVLMESATSAGSSLFAFDPATGAIVPNDNPDDTSVWDELTTGTSGNDGEPVMPSPAANDRPADTRPALVSNPVVAREGANSALEGSAAPSHMRRRGARRGFSAAAWAARRSGRFPINSFVSWTLRARRLVARLRHRCSRKWQIRADEVR